MKNFSIVLNIVLIAAVAVLSFKLIKGTSASKSPIFSCDTCTHDDFYGLSVSDFVEDVARYKKTHWHVISTAQDWPGAKDTSVDARACWFALDTLKKFICLIEKYSKQNKDYPLPSSELGVRFYYATYPSNLQWKPEYSNHHTLIMVPTFKGNNETDIDFDPRHNFSASSNPKTEPLSYLFNTNRQTQFLQLSAISSSNGMYKNQGYLCPPTCSPRSCPPNLNGTNLSDQALFELNTATNGMDMMQITDCVHSEGVSYGPNPRQ